MTDEKTTKETASNVERTATTSLRAEPNKQASLRKHETRAGRGMRLADWWANLALACFFNVSIGDRRTARTQYRRSNQAL